MSSGGPTRPRWEILAEQLEALASMPTEKQRALAETLKLDLPATTPAPVAAVLLRHHLHDELMESARTADGVPNVLHELEDELELTTRAHLTTGSHAELSAWFSARYLLKTAQGLRMLQPEAGDVVDTSLGRRIISTIGSDGAIFFKGRGRAWPNYVTAVSRVGDADHAEITKLTAAALRNATTVTSTNFARLAALEEFRLESNIPTPEAVRALEDQLQAGERTEEPLQQTLTRYPELLACLVIGGWRTYVIPKQRLGAEHVTDFLVLGLSSLGPQWVAVELEAARHPIINAGNARISPPSRHAINQIQDWREWLTRNIAYAENELSLYGINNRVPGLVIIGRDEPSTVRQSARAQVQEAEVISVRSWDWLVRSARNSMQNSLHVSDVAETAAAPLGYPTTVTDPRSIAEIENDPNIDLDELLAAE